MSARPNFAAVLADFREEAANEADREAARNAEYEAMTREAEQHPHTHGSYHIAATTIKRSLDQLYEVDAILLLGAVRASAMRNQNTHQQRWEIALQAIESAMTALHDE